MDTRAVGTRGLRHLRWGRAVALMGCGSRLCVMCGRMGASKSDSGRFIIVHTGGKVSTDFVSLPAHAHQAVVRHAGMNGPDPTSHMESNGSTSLMWRTTHHLAAVRSLVGPCVCVRCAMRRTSSTSKVRPRLPSCTNDHPPDPTFICMTLALLQVDRRLCLCPASLASLQARRVPRRTRAARCWWWMGGRRARITATRSSTTDSTSTSSPTRTTPSTPSSCAPAVRHSQGAGPRSTRVYAHVYVWALTELP